MKWLLTLPALYVAIFGLLITLQDRLIYPFDSSPVTPVKAGEPRLAEKTLTTPDGETLIVWAARATGRKPTLLYFHGNAGNLANRAQRFDRLLDRGYGVVALAYRGSSGSTGSPSEQALTADAVLLRRSLAQLLGQPPKGKIIYYGESLGTAVATSLASQIPPDGLLLEAPFTSLTELTAEKLPIFPTRHFLRSKWNTESRIKSLKTPLLILHGTKDEVIPYVFGKQIYQAAASQNKHLETLKGSGHANLWNIQGQTAIYRFINGL